MYVYLSTSLFIDFSIYSLMSLFLIGNIIIDIRINMNINMPVHIHVFMIMHVAANINKLANIK